MIQKGKGLADLFKNITRPLAPVLNPVFKEVETITRPLKPVLNPILKEAKGIGTAVGVNLADGLLQDLIAGKSSKASAKARGQQAGLNAKNMATARVLQALGQNGNGFPGGSGDPLIALDSDPEENIAKPSTKRKRTQSASQPPAKRKQTRKKTQKGGQLKNRKKRTQTGGFGLGGLIGSMYHGFDRLEKKARKRVLKRIDRKKRKKQAGKKRRKQKGRGKKRGPQGAGKGRKGKKRKSKKQKGGVRNDIFNPRATMTP